MKRNAIRTAVGVTLLAAGATAAAAPPACGSDALGTSRILALERTGAAYGRAQHAALPLAPNEVVITFDDGPEPASTPQVLEALERQCVRATFFMTGEALARSPALGAQVRAKGHSTGLHGFHHSHFASLSEAEQLADLRIAQETYERVFGARTAAWRFPFLEETAPLLAALKAQDVTVMSVDIGIDDWLPEQTPAMLTERLLERLKASHGGIILLHDAQKQTATALASMLKALKDNGYRVVHLEWP